MVKKYVKNPVVVEAIQWNGSNVDDVNAFVGKAVKFESRITSSKGATSSAVVEPVLYTLDGNVHVGFGDYIIYDDKKGFYVCNQEIFHETYVEV